MTQLTPWLQAEVVVEFTSLILGVGQLGRRSAVLRREFKHGVVIGVNPFALKIVNSRPYRSRPPWRTTDLEEKLATIAHELIHLNRGDVERPAGAQDRILEQEIDRVAYAIVKGERHRLDEILLELVMHPKSKFLYEKPETAFRTYLDSLARQELQKLRLEFGNERVIRLKKAIEKI